MSEWSHLANAKHIDRIIAHVEANYKTWDVAVRAAGYAQTQAARNAVRQAVYDAAWPAMVVAMRVRCFMSASRDWGDGDAACAA